MTTGKTTSETSSTKKPAAPRRATPKVSPLKGSSLGDYVANLADWQAQMVSALHELVLGIAPAATMAIKWAQPVYELGGPFAFIKPATKHVTFGFWRGSELADPAGLLDGTGNRMRHVKLAAGKELPHAALGAFVRQAVALNRSKGDPTRR